ncbi:MAG: hypothetical protein KC589_03030 [Nanoarchaeota archaeon]|nr:hypothetical protein [Nanoarchaeota archaeon]MCA9495891.1 hypothetical protein [Nanoarchaeota archaeon]
MEKRKRQILEQIFIVILIGIIIFGIYINTENPIDKFVDIHEKNNKEIEDLLKKSQNLSDNKKDELIEEYLQSNQKRINNMKDFKTYLVENKDDLKKENLDVEKYISEIDDILTHLKQSQDIVSKKDNRTLEEKIVQYEMLGGTGLFLI